MANVNTLLLASLLPAVLAFWRLPCHYSLGNFRVDPIISPGRSSSHAHTLHGSKGLSYNSDYADLKSAECTSCGVLQDMSAYWTPTLMFQHANGSIQAVPQLGGMTIYYFLFGHDIQPFPKGFQMVAGDSYRRQFTLKEPVPPQSLWGANDTTQDALSQKALGFTCLNYTPSNYTEGALERHYLPRKDWIDTHCLNGLRLELMFPSCWNGINIDSPSHKSHVAYPSLVMQGSCPLGFNLSLPGLFYETIWNTSAFTTYSGTYLLSNGDYTGYGYHGDFLNGWDIDTLRLAISQCTNSSGRVEDCSVFHLQDPEVANKCLLCPPLDLEKDDCIGPRYGLCGNVSIF